MFPRLALGAVVLGLLPQAQTFHVETRLVVLYATVRNDHGDLVTGLAREAFTVFENGHPQPITLFRNDDVPVSVGLVIDNSGSMRHKRAKVEAAALRFARASNPQDEMFVINFADTNQIDVPLTNDVHALEAGIARVDAIGGTAMRDAIAAGEAYVVRLARHERKALVVITDGGDNNSVSTVDQIRLAADQHQIAVYAIGILDPQEPGAPHARRALVELTDATGGLALFPASVEQVDSAGLELARQIRSQYTIGYTPIDQSVDNSYRKIRVAAKGQERLTVRTRAGYRSAASGSAAF